MFLDENVEVIYVCSQHLEEDMLHYYTGLLKGDEFHTKATEVSVFIRRFIVLTPEAVDYFPVR